jgi:hypothetical protein
MKCVLTAGIETLARRLQGLKVHYLLKIPAHGWHQDR